MWKCLIIIITWMHSNVSISSADYLAAADNTVNGSSELKWHSLIPRSIPYLFMMFHSVSGSSENITMHAICAAIPEGMSIAANSGCHNYFLIPPLSSCWSLLRKPIK